MNMSHFNTAYTSIAYVENVSEHILVLLSLSCDTPLSDKNMDVHPSVHIRSTQPLWAKATITQIAHYKCILDFLLDSITLPICSLTYTDVFCENTEHCNDIIMSFLYYCY